MKSIVQQSLGYLQASDSPGLLVPGREDHFVHAPAVVGQVVGTFQRMEKVISVQHGVGTDLTQPRIPHRTYVSIGPGQHPEVAVEPAYLANALLRRSQGEGLYALCLLSSHHRRRKVGQQQLVDTDGSGAGTSSTMGSSEGLVEVQVDHIETEMGQFYLPQQCVHIGSVAVHQPPSPVYRPTQFHDVSIE